MSSREQSQQLFRAVNERIHKTGGGFDVAAPHGLDLVCECGESTCTETLRIRLGEYERLPRAGSHFIVKPGHEQNGQTVLLRTAGYILVEDRAAADEPRGSKRAVRPVNPLPRETPEA
jgi:hypothetical protein